MGPVQFARSGRLRIAYRLAGDREAPVLVLIRGLSRTGRHWGSIAGDLARSFRLVLLDNRGVGRSSVPLLPYSIAHMADDTVRVMDAIGAERAHVFGMSLGGMIAQELALRHSQRVERLVLGCTRPGGAASVPMAPGTALALLGPMRLPMDQAIREGASLILGPDFVRQNPEIIDEWVELARELPVSRRGVLGQLLAALRHDASARLAGLRAPTLVVTGDADRLIDPENSRRLAALIPSARLELLPGAGHDFPTERPRQTAELLRRFLL